VKPYIANYMKTKKIMINGDIECDEARRTLCKKVRKAKNGIERLIDEATYDTFTIENPDDDSFMMNSFRINLANDHTRITETIENDDDDAFCIFAGTTLETSTVESSDDDEFSLLGCTWITKKIESSDDDEFGMMS